MRRVGRNEMRLKQLLGLLTLLLVLSTVSVAAPSQLTNVSATAQGNATVITLHASGAFTHTEYRPTDTLVLVDLGGVSAGKWKEHARNLDMPGVVSYHVLGYTGASGAEVARVELNIAPGATIDVNQAAGALNIRINNTKSAGNTATPAPEAKVGIAEKPAAPVIERAALKTPVQKSGPVMVDNIGISRADGLLDVVIDGTGPMTAKAMKLSSPARVVVDIENAVPSAKNRSVSVNEGDVRSVRMGMFKNQPPVTRVVVDLAGPRNFDLVSSGNKVVVRLHEASAAKTAPVEKPIVLAASPKRESEVPAPKAPVMQSEAPIQVASVATPKLAQQEPAPAQESQESKDFVMVEPKYHPASATQPINGPKATAEAAANVIATTMTNAAPAAMPVSASLSPQPQPAVNMAQQQAAPVPAAPARPKYTGEPISVNLKDVDLKDFFRLIHEISGLNIVLDPNVRGTLTLVLDDVPWDQALDLVLANNGLDRKLDANVLRIATVETLRKEADAIRAKNEAEALSVPKVTVTHFLSYARAADVVPTVKRFLTQRGDVIADTRTNALIIQDIPASVPEVQKLLVQLDRKTQEVEIEARVIAATRSFARDIGTQVGFGWGNGPSAVGGASSVGTSPLQVGAGSPKYFIVGSNQIPLFSNLAANGPTSGLSFNNVSRNYRLDVILTMAESRGLLKILSRPRIVTQNNVQALVRQGVRVPIVTAAQLGGPPTTTYVEAFLRLTVTPQITVENTIFLNIDVENTTPDFGQTVSGNPTLITQQATTSVLVTDGGTVVIGGVIQTQNSVNIQQVPLLGSIPVVGNLFKRRAVSTTTQELLFFVTPKIVQT